MAESDTRAEFCRLIAELDPVPVENLLATDKTIGQPDVDFANGAAELKWLRSWPVRPNTPVRLAHYTDAQKAWALRRAAAGEEVWLVIQCRQEWLVLDSLQSQQVGQLNRQQLIDLSTAYWAKKPSPEEFCKILTSRK